MTLSYHHPLDLDHSVLRYLRSLDQYSTCRVFGRDKPLHLRAAIPPARMPMSECGFASRRSQHRSY